MHKPRSRAKSRPSGNEAVTGDVIPPGKDPPGGLPPALYAEIVAQINQYTDRPDLLIEAIERHDPGFIKSMNEESREFAKKSRNSKFNFGRVQAYTSVVVQVLAAIAIFYVLILMAQNNHLNIWLLIGLGILFAITQSGMSGFLKIVGQISHMIRGSKGK